MNKILNDYGESTIAVGFEGSKARIECQYPKTIEQVFSKMVGCYISYEGVSRHFQYNELESLCNDNGISDAKTIGFIYAIAGEKFEHYKSTLTPTP